MTQSDWLYLSVTIAFICAMILAGILLEMYDRNSYMYGVDPWIPCTCTHAGHDHSYRSGRCRFRMRIGPGYTLGCGCMGFAPVKLFTIPERDHS